MRETIINAAISARRNYGFHPPTDGEIQEARNMRVVTVGTVVVHFFREFCEDENDLEMFHGETEKYLADEVLEVTE